MTAMTLFWSSRSPFARKVAICSHELALADQIELKAVTVMTGMVNPEVSRHNPLSKIPVLVLESGEALLDSAVICAYLNERADAALVPRDPALRWRALTIEAMSDGALDALIYLRNEMARQKPKAEIVAALEIKCAQALDRLEMKAETLSALHPSIAEIAIGCFLGYLDFRFTALDWRAHRPNLEALYAELCTRPSFELTGHKES